MFTLWILLISTVCTLASETSTAPDINITTLYPVFKKPARNEIQNRFSDTETKPSDKRISNDTETVKNNRITSDNDTETMFNKTDTKSKTVSQTWKIESGFAASNLTDESNTNNTGAKEKQEKKELLKDFKPSQHLGSFFDDDRAEVIKQPVFGPVHKKPASGFISSIKDDYPHATFNKIPKEVFYTHQKFPYKFEDTIYTKTKGRWTDSMESRPTVEVPVKVPAGGLYQSPDPFQETAHSNEEYGLEYYEDGKDHAVNKRGNPWQSLLRLVTAFIPVGLIISALTPSIITIQNVDDNTPPSSLPYRRSDPVVPGEAPISERCRRRLLCELHSERNYLPPTTRSRRSMKHCYKLHCEDTDALWRMLRWLFSYNQQDLRDADQRGRLLT